VTLTAHNGNYSASVDFHISNNLSSSHLWLWIIGIVILIIVIAFVVFAVKQWGGSNEEESEGHKQLLTHDAP